MKRMIAWIPVDAYVQGEGYRVSIVKEGEAGHYPTGNWPYKAGPGQQMPWFWGHDLAQAQRLADEYNEKMGISREEAEKIVNDSIRRQFSDS